MSAAIQPGLPVEIGRIDKELGRLWESSDDTKTRASLINLAIYTEDPSAVAGNTAIVSEIASQHACRAILILANRSATESSAKAWISAHCHIAGKGGRQICSEQITFQLDGDAADALPNIVFSHLDSDLPLCFWWQGNFHDAVDEKLWAWVDRLIFDSAGWADPAVQFARAQKIVSRADSSPVLCDLNWTRLYHYRFALASLFDHAAAMACLSRIDSVRIVCSPGHRTTGLLLLGWLAAQLGWTLQHLLSRHFFSAPDGRQVAFELVEEPGAAVSLVRLACGEAFFELRREEGSEFFHGCIHAPGVSEAFPTLGAGREKITEILVSELSRGGRHTLYGKAVNAVTSLF